MIGGRKCEKYVQYGTLKIYLSENICDEMFECLMRIVCLKMFHKLTDIWLCTLTFPSITDNCFN